MSKNFSTGKFEEHFDASAGIAHQNLLDACEFKSIHSQFKSNPDNTNL
jgi:hypothetical protein